jgi:hypothetical protein
LAALLPPGFPGKQQMAERERFELSVPVLGVHTISNRAPSAARSPLRKGFVPRGKRRFFQGEITPPDLPFSPLSWTTAADRSSKVRDLSRGCPGGGIPHGPGAATPRSPRQPEALLSSSLRWRIIVGTQGGKSRKCSKQGDRVMLISCASFLRALCLFAAC